MQTFRLRYDDVCPECKVNLEIRGVKDNEKLKRFEVIAYCPKCKAIYEFIRWKRRENGRMSR